MTRLPAIVVALVAALASCSDAGPLLLRNHDNSPMSEQTKGADTVTNTIDSTTAKTTTVNQESEGQYFDEKNFTSTLDELINSNGTVREEEEEVEDDDDDDAAGTSDGDGTLSAIWYLAAFGGLVLFFFVVTCSELFLDNPVHARRQMDLPHAGYLRRHYLQRHTVGGHFGPETPPPPYHLFAPPSYDDFVKSGLQEKPPRCDKHRAEEKPSPAAAAKEKPMTPAADPVYILPLHHVPTMMFQPPFRSHKTPPLVVAEMTKQLNAAWQQNGKPRATDDE